MKRLRFKLNVVPDKSAKYWYDRARQYIEYLAIDKSHVTLLCDLIAATSPRKQVKNNIILAYKIYHEYVTTGKIVLTGIMGTHKKNVIRACTGQALSGNKVRAFAENLKGNLQVVTIDMHIIKAYHKSEVNITDTVYKFLSDKIRSEASDLGIMPARYQAMVWQASRTKYQSRQGKKLKVMPVTFDRAITEVINTI